MNHFARRIMTALATILCLAPNARAVVVVSEDFFYNEPTKAIFNLAGFTTQSYGGGQNGAGGVWDDRWVAVGGTTIVGADAAPPLDAHPYTAVVTEVASAASLQRSYLPTGAGESASTIYFAGDFLVEDVTVPRIFAEFGILSPTATLDVPQVSLGITDSAGTGSPTFFAKIGTTVLTGNPLTNANDAVDSATTYRIVGKLQFNTAPGTGDYDRNGLTDGADFLLWQRQQGSAANPAGSGADGDSSGQVNGADLAVWSGAFGTSGAERLTVYFNPTGVETTAATVLTGTADVVNGFGDTSLSRIATLNADAAGTNDSDRAHFIDNLAIGTTWADVAAVNVPRLTLEVNTGNGQTRLINNSGQSIPLAYYEILSPGDSLSVTGWSSLDDQNTSGGTWKENNPGAGQLIESNLTSSTTIASGGGTLNLGAAFTVGGDQDLVARWGTKQGADGLLNLANVVYVTSAVAAPEPAAWSLAIVALAALGGRRLARKVDVT